MGGTVQPFLKWAGGKRWLAQIVALPPLNENGRYFEPFLGSAAMFFAMRPNRAILSDANAALIELYDVVRDSPIALATQLAVHQDLHSPEHYYRVRASYPREKVERAAKMLYLNRTCWNGLYRVNRRGQFNVPIGTKTRVVMDDDFEALAEILRAVELRHCDFSTAIADAGPGDVVYADPPYTVRHNCNGFIKYNEEIFTWQDQIRLRDEAVKASERGAIVAVSNADHESLRELYEGVATFKRLRRSSVIASAPTARGKTTEALFLIRPSRSASPNNISGTQRPNANSLTFR